MKKFITRFVFYLVSISIVSLILNFIFAAINQVFVEQVCSPINETWIDLKNNFGNHLTSFILLSLLFSFSDVYSKRVVSFVENMLPETTIIKLNSFIESYQSSKWNTLITVVIPALLLLVCLIILITQSIYC